MFVSIRVSGTWSIFSVLLAADVKIFNLINLSENFELSFRGRTPDDTFF